jgi:2-polyprenyl-6-methoxyphenol hydroxylase-like FAD-dependent oxidoreductase
MPRRRLARVHLHGPDGPMTLSAPLVVAADGSASAVRAALGIGTVEHDYGQTVFVARLRAERAPDGTAYERFGDAGPTALLPRGDRHWGLIHAVPGEQVDAVAALDEAGWLARVQAAFGWRIGRFLECGPRSRYPLVRVLAERLTAPQVALLGNAAQAIHPVGAQGFNLGLRDALTLAELIEDGLRPAIRLCSMRYADAAAGRPRAHAGLLRRSGAADLQSVARAAAAAQPRHGAGRPCRRRADAAGGRSDGFSRRSAAPVPRPAGRSRRMSWPRNSMPSWSAAA